MGRRRGLTSASNCVEGGKMNASIRGIFQATVSSPDHLYMRVSADCLVQVCRGASNWLTSSIKTEHERPIAVESDWRNTSRIRSEQCPLTFWGYLDGHLGIGAIGSVFGGWLGFTDGLQSVSWQSARSLFLGRVVVVVAAYWSHNVSERKMMSAQRSGVLD
jgi:hypothetical protein